MFILGLIVGLIVGAVIGALVYKNSPAHAAAINAAVRTETAKITITAKADAIKAVNAAKTEAEALEKKV